MSEDAVSPIVIDVATAGRILNESRHEIEKRIERGELRKVQFGRYVRVAADGFDPVAGEADTLVALGDPDDQLLVAVKVDTAARMLDCSRPMIYKLIEQGELATVRLGTSSAVRVPVEDIYRFAGLEPPRPTAGRARTRSRGSRVHDTAPA